MTLFKAHVAGSYRVGHLDKYNSIIDYFNGIIAGETCSVSTNIANVCLNPNNKGKLKWEGTTYHEAQQN